MGLYRYQGDYKVILMGYGFTGRLIRLPEKFWMLGGNLYYHLCVRALLLL